MNIVIRRPNEPHKLHSIRDGDVTDEFTPGETVEFYVNDVPSWHQIAEGFGAATMSKSDYTPAKIPPFGKHRALMQPNGESQIPIPLFWTLKAKDQPPTNVKPGKAANWPELVDAIAAGANDITVSESIKVPSGDHDLRGVTLRAGPNCFEVLTIDQSATTVKSFTFFSNVKRFGVEIRATAAINDVTIGNKNPGDGIRVSSAAIAVISDLKATTFARYAVYGENAQSVSITGSRINGGSITEAVFRFHGCHTVGLIDNEINYTIPGKTISRIHDGQSATLRREKYTCVPGVTALGVGPLGRGDGGQEEAICQYPDGNYNAGHRKQAIKLAIEMARTGVSRQNILNACAAIGGKSPRSIELAEHDRKQALALRMPNVSVVDCEFNGAIVLNAGASGEFKNCRINAAKPFSQWVKSYPELAHIDGEPSPGVLQIPGDAPRPVPAMRFVGCIITGDELGIDPKFWPSVTFPGSTFNGGPIR